MLLPLGWEKGWLAIRQTLRFDAKDMSDEGLTRLRAQEGVARPRTLVDRTKAVVLNGYSSGVDITDGDPVDDARSHERADEVAEELGTLVAADAESFGTLLSQLMENRQGRHWRFGAGLAKGAADAAELWTQLVLAFASVDSAARNIQVLVGFLSGLSAKERNLFERLLDDAVEDTTLAEWLPVLQISAKLDPRGCDRLIRSLMRGAAPIERYKHLAYGSVTSELPDADVVRLLREVAGKDNGLQVAIDVLGMHLYGNKKSASVEIRSLGSELLAQMPVPLSDLDFMLALLVKKCLVGTSQEPAARAVLRRMRSGLDNYSLSLYQVGELVGALFTVQPIAALDELIGDEPDTGAHFIRRRDLAEGHGKNPLSGVPIETMLSWCRAGSVHRWPKLAASIPALKEPTGEGSVIAWSDAAIALLKAAPRPIQVIDALVDRIPPTSWSGSRAEIMTARLPLFDALEFIQDNISERIKHLKEEFQRTVDRERQSEQDHVRSRMESFE